MPTAYLEVQFELADMFWQVPFEENIVALEIAEIWRDDAVQLFKERRLDSPFVVSPATDHGAALLVFYDGVQVEMQMDGDGEEPTLDDDALCKKVGQTEYDRLSREWLLYFQAVRGEFDRKVDDHYEDMRSNG